MNEPTESAPNRIEAISKDMIFQLARVGSGTLPQLYIIPVLEQLPQGLSMEEIDLLGYEVAHNTELVAPSRDGYRNGRHNEAGLVKELGFFAALAKDFTTAENAVQRLKSINGINNRAAAFMIKRAIKKNIPRKGASEQEAVRSSLSESGRPLI